MHLSPESRAFGPGGAAANSPGRQPQVGLPLIIERLNDKEPLVRRSAVVALLKIGSPDAREALTRVSDDEDWEVRLYAEEALKRLEP